MKERLIIPTREQTLILDRATAHKRHIEQLVENNKIGSVEQWEAIHRAHLSITLAGVDAGLDFGINEDFRELVREEKKKAA